MEVLMSDFQEDIESRTLQSKLGELAPYARHVQELVHWQGLQARMPYTIRVK